MIKIIYGIVLFIFIASCQYFLIGKFSISNDLITNIITFLSIIFGFYITSLAIFVTSQYVSGLYKIVDKENQTVTLLHTLVKNYKIGLTAILISILYLLFLNFYISQSIDKSSLLNNFKVLPFLPLVVFNFCYSYKMLSDLINVIIQEAKHKAVNNSS